MVWDQSKTAFREVSYFNAQFQWSQPAYQLLGPKGITYLSQIDTEEAIACAKSAREVYRPLAQAREKFRENG